MKRKYSYIFEYHFLCQASKAALDSIVISTERSALSQRESDQMGGAGSKSIYSIGAGDIRATESDDSIARDQVSAYASDSKRDGLKYSDAKASDNVAYIQSKSDERTFDNPVFNRNQYAAAPASVSASSGFSPSNRSPPLGGSSGVYSTSRPSAAYDRSTPPRRTEPSASPRSASNGRGATAAAAAGGGINSYLRSGYGITTSSAVSDSDRSGVTAHRFAGAARGVYSSYASSSPPSPSSSSPGGRRGAPARPSTAYR
jgi:hypothetical protein